MTERIQSRASLFTFILVMGGFLFVTARMIAPYVLSIMTGGLMALLIHPLYKRLCNRGLGPKLSSGIVTALLVLLVILPLVLFTLMAVRQAVSFTAFVTHSDKFSVPGLIEQISQWGPISTLVDNPQELEKDIQNILHNSTEAGTAIVLGLAKGLPDNLLQLVLACLSCFFFVIDGKRFSRWLGSLVPSEPDIRTKLGQSFKNTAISVVWASAAAAGTQALIMFIGFKALGVPAAALGAAATFIFAWVPMVGMTPVWIGALIYLWIQGSMVKFGIMIAFGLATGIVDNFVRPLVLRGRGEMHPLVSLVAIFGGIQMFGITGVFFGPILAAALITLLTVWPDVGRRGGMEFEK